MIIFYSIAVLLTLLVLAWLLRPLFYSKRLPGLSSQRLNVDIYRDQLEALGRDLAQGAITPADYETACDELQLRLLDDADEAPKSAAPKRSVWPTAWVMSLLLVFGGFGFYAWLGEPQAIDAVASQKAQEEQIFAMVDRLAARLQAQPDDPQGWAILARSYKVLGRLEDAEQAYAKVGALLDTDPGMLTDYADLLATRANGSLAGRPLALINKALALNPQHPMALMLSGAGAYQQGDYAKAASQWEKMLPLINPESPDRAQLQNSIADARAKAGLSAPAKP
jgi:cytochrome c-type biogenesis protein CcmH